MYRGKNRALSASVDRGRASSAQALKSAQRIACTVAVPLLVLVVLALRHVSADRPHLGAKVDTSTGDSSTLVQVSVGTETQAEWIPIVSALQNARWATVPVLQNARRYRHKYFVFPLRITKQGPREDENVYHLVGSASLTLDLSSMHIHCYDVALYLNVQSTEWEMMRHGHAATLDVLLGDVQIVLILQSTYITNKVMADVSDKLLEHAKKLNATNPSQDVELYKRMWLRAPAVRPGAEIVLVPQVDGVSARINGKDMGLVKSSFLGPATMESYLGEHSTLPEFRDRVFSNLGRGMREVVEEPAQVSTVVHTPWWYTSIKVVAVIAVVLCLCGTGCCCFRYCRMWKQQA